MMMRFLDASRSPIDNARGSTTLDVQLREEEAAEELKDATKVEGCRDGRCYRRYGRG